MKELSLNILDIAENSTKANAKLIILTIVEDTTRDVLEIELKDDGCGMAPEFLKKVTDPFTTTRTTRKVGMGIPLFKEAAEETGGHFEIISKEGMGTEIKAVFGYSHIDRMPLGDMAGTVSTLVQCHPDTDFLYTHRFDSRSFVFDTREVREILGGVSLGEPEVALWVREFLQENLNELYGGI